MNNYQNPDIGQKYLNFLDSPDGHTQRQVLGAAIQKRLPDIRTIRVLDAACGSGWLTHELAKQYDHVQGFDSSEFLLHHAKQNYPEINIARADLAETLPYPNGYFDLIVLNMAASDADDLHTMYTELARVLQPNGKLIVTIPNPAYMYPVGVWKRGLIRWLFRQKPILRLRPVSEALKTKLPNKHTFSQHYYPLSAQIKNARHGNLYLTHIDELSSQTDSPEFNLQYQLFRFPLFLLLEFIKHSE